MKVESSCLSDCFLPRFSFDPSRWCELLDLRNLGRWQTGEQIFQIIKGVDPMPPTTAQQRINHRAAFPGFRMPNEQPVFLSKSHWAVSNFRFRYCQFPKSRRQ